MKRKIFKKWKIQRAKGLIIGATICHGGKRQNVHQENLDYSHAKDVADKGQEDSKGKRYVAFSGMSCVGQDE